MVKLFVKQFNDWFTVERIDAQTYAISEYGHWEQVHSYLVIGDHLAVLIDTGLGIGDIKTVVEQLTSLPVKVLTTHVHWDHIGGHGSFSEVYVHPLEQDWLVHAIPGLPLDTIRQNIGRDITKPLPPGFNLADYELFKGIPTGLLNDNQNIDLGSRVLTVIHTPGHSPGHICIYEAQRGYLYTGDLIYKGTLYANYPSTNPMQFVKSVEEVSRFNVNKILPGHNELSLHRDFLLVVNTACQDLLTKGLVKHGSGLHNFQNLKIYF